MAGVGPLERNVLLNAAAAHAERLRSLGVEPAPARLDLPGAARDVQVEHVLWVLDRVHEHVAAGDVGKAERWLCFAQGVLWSLGHLSIDECRALNRGEG